MIARIVPWSEMPAGARALLVLTCALTLGFAAHCAMPGDFQASAGNWIYNAALTSAALLVMARARARSAERLPWALVAFGLVLFAGGNVYWALVFSEAEYPPFPSFADALWIAFLPVTYAAVVLLIRRRLPHLDSRMWLDGVIAALTVAAVSAAIVFDAVQASTGGDAAAVATNLAYPLGDMVLIGTVIGALTAARGRLDATWVSLGVGLAVFMVTDSAYLWQVARGTYEVGSIVDVGWPLGALLIALASWHPARRERAIDKAPSIGVPVLLALTSLAILVVDHFAETNLLALGLATASVLAVVMRLVLTHRESQDNLLTSRHQARTDSLTGLGNRFALVNAMDVALAHEEPHALLLFDLDGFKNYNDSYGHPAGDALLARLGSRLAAATAGRAAAYRIGGDEFCVLAPWSHGRPIEPLVESARAALTEEGDGFRVGASCGHALLPGEACDGAEALRIADRRLYAEKHSGRVSARVQSTRVLRRALAELDPELVAHTDDVAGLAARVARRLGLDHEDVERTTTAAELHDIGKIAIPRSILRKPGPLDEEEWAFMRRHTLIGERIAQGAPALAGVASLIRSSHERWDGRGYPDGLAAQEIPLGAQIVFVCDSFSAMTSDRCYRPGLSVAEALEELRRNAGTQFAPAVVDAFVAEHAAAFVHA